MSTLTLNILKSIHLSISPIILHKLYSTATSEYLRVLLQENYVFIVTLAPDVLRVYFYDETDFLYYSSTFQLLLFPKHIKRLYLSSKASLPCGRLSSAMWRLCRANSSMVAMEINTSSGSANDFWLL